MAGIAYSALNLGDEKIVVASFFSHHLCVFDIDKKDHIQTLEQESSLLHLYVSALTHDGSYLVHTNYDEDEKVRTRVTLFSICLRMGTTFKRKFESVFTYNETLSGGKTSRTLYA